MITPSFTFRRSPNEKLRIGCVGVGGRGGANLNEVSHEDIVALCDVDETILGRALKDRSKSRGFVDYRHMLDRVPLDGLVVSTPDHTHACVGLEALKRKIPLYCEKPLAWSIREVRQMREAAKDSGCATQMGTQIHSRTNYRRVVELVQSDAIGEVTEVHVWVGRAWSAGDRPTDRPPIPKGLHYDLWLGPAPHRPYHPAHVRERWRNWWDFGGGTLSDMACHHMDLPKWALKLGAPTKVESKGPPLHPDGAPKWLEVRYDFPVQTEDGKSERTLPLTWYHGGKRPAMFDEEGRLPRWGDGTLFVGKKGLLLANYDRLELLPEDRFKDYQRPDPWILDSIGHHREWTQAIRGEGTPSCSFEYGGELTEAVLLGNVAFRAGGPVVWDGDSGVLAGPVGSDGYLGREPRTGW